MAKIPYDPTSGPPTPVPSPASAEGIALYGNIAAPGEDDLSIPGLGPGAEAAIRYGQLIEEYEREIAQYEVYQASQQQVGATNPELADEIKVPPIPSPAGDGPIQESKAIDLANYDPVEALSFKEMSKTDKVAFSGVGGTSRREGDVPHYIKTGAEKVLSKGNAFIVLGVDRSGNRLEGYGGLGNTHCASIDIVAGRMGVRARKRDDNKPFPKPVWCNPSFVADAARIYVSQKADVDAYFGLVAGTVGNTEYEAPRSTVAIKADTIRVIGREGIKLITKTDTQNSQGGVVHGKPGIDLIALNDDEDMQPLVKGDNLIGALKEVLKLIDDLRDLFNNFVTYQKDYNRTLMSHTHYSPFYGQLTSPDPQVVQQGVQCMIDTVRNVEVGIQSHMMNSVGVSINYLELPMGGKDSTYINSTYNHTN